MIITIVAFFAIIFIFVLGIIFGFVVAKIFGKNNSDIEIRNKFTDK